MQNFGSRVPDLILGMGKLMMFKSSAKTFEVF
jgi:hypothetical protein